MKGATPWSLDKAGDNDRWPNLFATDAYGNLYKDFPEKETGQAERDSSRKEMAVVGRFSLKLSNLGNL